MAGMIRRFDMHDLDGAGLLVNDGSGSLDGPVDIDHEFRRMAIVRKNNSDKELAALIDFARDQMLHSEEVSHCLRAGTVVAHQVVGRSGEILRLRLVYADGVDRSTAVAAATAILRLR